MEEAHFVWNWREHGRTNWEHVIYLVPVVLHLQLVRLLVQRPLLDGPVNRAAAAPRRSYALLRRSSQRMELMPVVACRWFVRAPAMALELFACGPAHRLAVALRHSCALDLALFCRSSQPMELMPVVPYCWFVQAPAMALRLFSHGPAHRVAVALRRSYALGLRLFWRSS